MTIVKFDADEAEWVGDEKDGCHVAVGKDDDGWYYTVVVDSDTGAFVQDLAADIGPYGTREEALRDGKSQAVEWCIENRVCWEEKT